MSKVIKNLLTSLRARTKPPPVIFMKTVIVSATDGCKGCICYVPGRKRSEHIFHQHCINGSYHAPAECARNKTIMVEDPDA